MENQSRAEFYKQRWIDADNLYGEAEERILDEDLLYTDELFFQTLETWCNFQIAENAHKWDIYEPDPVYLALSKDIENRTYTPAVYSAVLDIYTEKQRILFLSRHANSTQLESEFKALSNIDDESAGWINFLDKAMIELLPEDKYMLKLIDFYEEAMYRCLEANPGLFDTEVLNDMFQQGAAGDMSHSLANMVHLRDYCLKQGHIIYAKENPKGIDKLFYKSSRQEPFVLVRSFEVMTADEKLFTVLFGAFRGMFGYPENRHVEMYLIENTKLNEMLEQEIVPDSELEVPTRPIKIVEPRRNNYPQIPKAI